MKTPTGSLDGMETEKPQTYVNEAEPSSSTVTISCPGFGFTRLPSSKFIPQTDTGGNVDEEDSNLASDIAASCSVWEFGQGRGGKGGVAGEIGGDADDREGVGQRGGGTSSGDIVLLAGGAICISGNERKSRVDEGGSRKVSQLHHCQRLSQILPGNAKLCIRMHAAICFFQGKWFLIQTYIFILTR